MKYRFIALVILGMFISSVAAAQTCIDCHKKISPNIVKDWQLSKHSKNKIDCSICHGDQHKSASDVAKVKIPTP